MFSEKKLICSIERMHKTLTLGRIVQIVQCCFSQCWKLDMQPQLAEKENFPFTARSICLGLSKLHVVFHHYKFKSAEADKGQWTLRDSGHQTFTQTKWRLSWLMNNGTSFNQLCSNIFTHLSHIRSANFQSLIDITTTNSLFLTFKTPWNFPLSRRLINYGYRLDVCFVQIRMLKS